MCVPTKNGSQKPSYNGKHGMSRFSAVLPACRDLFKFGLLAAISLVARIHILPMIRGITFFWFLAPTLFVLLLVGLALLTLILTTVLLTNPKKPWTGAGDFLSNFSWDGKRPLNITFITWGSRGDHQPNVALGLELARRGHHVTVLGLECYRSVIERHPQIKYVPYEDKHIFAMASALNKPGNESQLPILCSKFVADSCPELIPQYIKAAKDADVLVGQQIPLCVLAHFTSAEVAKKPLFFVAHDAAASLPTTAFSYDPSSNRIKNHGWLANIINTRAIPIIVGALNTLSPWSEVRAYRHELGLSTRWPFMEILGPRAAASIPTFCTWDPTLWPRPDDYSPHWFSTGFFTTKGNDADDSDGVMDWLNKRSSQEPERKLVYAALGSFDHHDKSLYTDLLLQAAQELSLDIITLTKTVDDRVMPPNVFVAKEIPQAEVFPKCEVIVHHGGAGTSAQVIRSGRPGICIPAMHFQQTWGARLEEYGAGLMVTQPELAEAYQSSGHNKLLEAIEAVMNNSEMNVTASMLGEKAREAPGVKLAADKMLEYLEDVVCEK